MRLAAILMIAREGFPYVLVPIVAALIAFALGDVVVAIMLLSIAAFMAFFFRDPQRLAPSDPQVIVSPADGRVTRIAPIDANDTSSPVLVSIFLSPLDVHVNRSPIAGKITDISYKRGRFLIATSDHASVVNEQNVLTISGAAVTVICKQIAGVLARRIVCWKRPGDEVAIGERFGLIKFSSRTDLILPAEVTLMVREGSRVRGGVTVIGRINGT